MPELQTSAPPAADTFDTSTPDGRLALARRLGEKTHALRPQLEATDDAILRVLCFQSLHGNNPLFASWF